MMAKVIFLPIVDDSSRFTWLYLLKKKLRSLKRLNNSLHLSRHNLTNISKALDLPSNNMKELALVEFLQDHSDFHQFACPY